MKFQNLNALPVRLQTLTRPLLLFLCLWTAIASSLSTTTLAANLDGITINEVRNPPDAQFHFIAIGPR